MTDPLVGAVLAGGAVIMAAAMTLAGVVLGHLFKRMSDLEAAHATLWAAREADALTKRRMGDHIDTLEDHIRFELGPPPPPRPDGV